MSNVMTPERLSALQRLRDAHGDYYCGMREDAYEMFLVVDECFRNSETEQVATWLPYTPRMELGEGEFLFAIRDVLSKDRLYIFRVWDARGLADRCLAGSVDWYMPLSPHKLPAMKIQEAVQHSGGL